MPPAMAPVEFALAMLTAMFIGLLLGFWLALVAVRTGKSVVPMATAEPGCVGCAANGCNGWCQCECHEVR